MQRFSQYIDGTLPEPTLSIMDGQSVTTQIAVDLVRPCHSVLARILLGEQPGRWGWGGALTIATGAVLL